MQKQEEFTFTAQSKGRLDSIISKEMEFSRNRVKKMLDVGWIYVNNAPSKNASLRIVGGENIRVLLPSVENHLEPEESSLEILYQDTDLAVVVKPAGLTVHPCPSCEEKTLVHQLLYHFPELRKLEGERPGIVHRLDKDTSGLMVIALHEEARLQLVEAFADRRVHKTYLALVAGQCEKGESEESIGRHPTFKTKMAQVPLNKGGREAYTTWERLFPPPLEEAVTKQGKNIPVPKSLQSPFSLMAVKIYTGRTHQIRVHLSEAGFPLLGDSTYAHGANAYIAESAKRQMLHAWKLSFEHPITGQYLSFTCPLPQDFMDTMMTLWQKDLSFQKIIVTGCSGAGKSALLEAFSKRNVPVFSADACVQKLYEPNQDAWYLLKNQYGHRFVHPQEEHSDEGLEIIDKQALFEAMKEPNMRREIENIVHPLVFDKLRVFFEEAKKHTLTKVKNLKNRDPEIFQQNSLDTSQKYRTCNVHEESNESKENRENRGNKNDVGTCVPTNSGKQNSDKQNSTGQNYLSRNAFCSFAVAEIPLWFESQSVKNNQQGKMINREKQTVSRQNKVHIQAQNNDIDADYTVICITCEEDTRLSRLRKRGWSEDTIALMDSWQWAQEYKASNANYVIDNTDEKSKLEENVQMILQSIQDEQDNLIQKRIRIVQKNMNGYE